jgi:hypothetical protein
MAAKLYEPLMEFSENPIKGVKLEEAFQVFGEWDFAVFSKQTATLIRFILWRQNPISRRRLRDLYRSTNAS